MMVKRVLPSQSAPYTLVDPFLLLDDASIDPSDPGFPRHPHRGFEIITYLLAGAFGHADSAGNESIVRAGGLQKITAGKGMWHSEMPAGDGGPGRGLQLWINLARAEKQIEPDYQIVEPEDVPVVERDQASVRVLAGEGSTVKLRTPSLYLDVAIADGGGFHWDLPPEFAGFVYVIDGQGVFGSEQTSGEAGKLLVLGEGDLLEAGARSGPVRFILCAGRPHREPVLWRGPFVD